MRSEPIDHRGSLRLFDGRRLAYCEAGPRTGVPVFYCHGAIGTPLGREVDLEAIAASVGVRYIAVSRPGIGGSDPAPGRTVLTFAGDLRQLADALELDRFAVVGVSAGGPYALAAARELPDRVARVAVCSSLSPLCAPHRTPGMRRRIRAALALVARAPGLCATVGDAALPAIRSHPELLSRVIAAHAAPGERARLRCPDERSAASASFFEAASGGLRGLVDDYLTYSRPWGFSVAGVETEVQLWHGLHDPLVPIEHALQLAITLPRCALFLDPDEGHHFFRRRLQQILALLVRGDDGAAGGLATSVARARALAAGRAREARRRRLPQ
jgi:pimeloyl-ACP methyl ester carboxylesterase